MKIKKLLLLLIILNANTIVAQKKYDLKPVTVTAYRTPDTVFGTWKFNVDDYAFYEDKFILLTFEKNLEHAKVMLADATQKVLSTFELPDEAETPVRKPLLALMSPEATPEKVDEHPRPHSMIHGCLRQAHV